MHKALVDEIVKSCRQREREGDCMTVPQPTMLEDAVLALALENDQLRAAPSPPPETRAAGVTEEEIGQELRLWSVERRRWPVKIDPTGCVFEEAWAVMRDRIERSRHNDKFEASEAMYDALARAILALTHNPAAEGGN